MPTPLFSLFYRWRETQRLSVLLQGVRAPESILTCHPASCYCIASLLTCFLLHYHPANALGLWVIPFYIPYNKYFICRRCYHVNAWLSVIDLCFSHIWSHVSCCWLTLWQMFLADLVSASKAKTWIDSCGGFSGDLVPCGGREELVVMIW